MPKQKPLYFSIPVHDIQQLLFKTYPSIIPRNKDDMGDAMKMTGDIEPISIEQILHDSSDRYRYIYDPFKSPVKIWLNMTTYDNTPLPEYTDKPCYYDHHPYSTSPIGCPIKYDNDTDTFYTKGMFCSFPCIKSYINDQIQKGHVEMKQSFVLLSLMFRKLREDGGVPTGIVNIPYANNIGLIDTYGGHLNINEWRASVEKVNYQLMPTVNYNRSSGSKSPSSAMQPVSSYFVETVLTNPGVR
jgi:hypothetical protein